MCQTDRHYLDRTSDKNLSILKKLTLQEEVNDAFKSDSDKEDEEAEENGESDGERSSESGFGLKGKPKKKSAPLKRQRTKAPQSGTPVPPAAETSAPSTSGKADAPSDVARVSASDDAATIKSFGSGSRKDEKQIKNTASVLTKAQGFCASLGQILPQVLWQQPSKCKDLDLKIKKAMDTLELLKLIKEDKATDLYSELNDLVERLSRWSEIVNRIQAADADKSAKALFAKLQRSKTALAKALPLQAPDCIRAVLIDIGKMLAEALGFGLLNCFWFNSIKSSFQS